MQSSSQTFDLRLNQISTILLDIEGTIAPIQFVSQVLFPFAQTHLRSFLTEHATEPGVQQDLALLFQEYEADLAQGLALPLWEPGEALASVDYINALIEQDRKSTGLKSLQGKIWDQGYRSGDLRSQLFQDTKPAFERWTKAGYQLYIFSSGSVQAQKLLLQFTEVGDLTPYICGYFDTTTGPKKTSESYRAIAQSISVPCRNILFISDIEAELMAAGDAGLYCLLSVRPGNHIVSGEHFRRINSLDQVF